MRYSIIEPLKGEERAVAIGKFHLYTILFTQDLRWKM